MDCRGVAAVLLAATACAGAPPVAQSAGDRSAERTRMVETQIRDRGIRNARVLDAMRRVPRHEFVPADQQPWAYDDRPLPIGHGQTISQPYIVAYMTEALDPKPTDRVLEIGTGSGYQAAVLAEVAGQVYTIEIVEPLAGRARGVLDRLGYANIQARQGDGYRGWPEAAPFQKIIVTAAPEEVPQALVDQLAIDGIMVVPVGRGSQMMTIIRRTKTGVVTQETIPVLFVPMIRKD